MWHTISLTKPSYRTHRRFQLSLCISAWPVRMLRQKPGHRHHTKLEQDTYAEAAWRQPLHMGPNQVGSISGWYVINARPWMDIITWRQYDYAQLSRRATPSNTRSCATHITSEQYTHVCDSPVRRKRYRGAPCWPSYRPIRTTHKRHT